MKLGLQTMRPTTVFGTWSSDVDVNVRAVRFAERLGYDSVWTAEAAGTDAFVPLAWLAAHTKRIKLATGIAQLSARTPAMTAMTTATLDRLSGGRTILGLGVSGRALVEGWHGQRFDEPLARTEEYVAIVREVMHRRNPRRVATTHYPLPHPEAHEQHPATARLMFRPTRPQVPIYLAAAGPRSVGLAHRVADGVVPPFFSPHHEAEFFAGTSVERLRDGFELAPFVAVAVGQRADEAIRHLKPSFAFWLGGMGSGATNYYAQLAERLGFLEFPAKVKHLFRAGYRADAAAAVPDDFVDAVALCGPVERIAERLDAWKASSVTTMVLTGLDKRGMVAIAEQVL